MSDQDPGQRIAGLERAVDELRAEVERLRQGRARPMSTTGRCPACGGAEVLHFRKVKDAAYTGLIDFALLKEHSVWRGMVKVAGTLEAFACRDCRLVEWRAISLDGVEPDGVEVVALTAVDSTPPESGPYR